MASQRLSVRHAGRDRRTQKRGALLGSMKAAQQDPKRVASSRAKFAVRKGTPTTTAKPAGHAPRGSPSPARSIIGERS